MRKIDITGQRFGRLVAIKPIVVNGYRKWLCGCDCGNLKSVASGALRCGRTKSCGCLSKEFTDLTGQTFGRLTVESRNEEKTKNGYIHWNCVCECGNRVVVSTSNLTNKDVSKRVHSCGCLRRESSSKRFSSKLEDMKFGKLTVLYRIGTQIQGNGDKKSFWHCKCDCGAEVDVIGKNLLNGNTQSCGCVISRGELMVREYLNANGIRYLTQKSYDYLRSSNGGKLRFDFAILDNGENIVGLIEYQGIQHYKDTNIGKLEREETDELKRLYYKSHNIPLLEILYNQDLKSLIDEFLQSINYKPILCQASNEEG